MKLRYLTLIFIFIFAFINVNAQQEIIDTTAQEIFITPENYPEYPGGDKARLHFIAKNLVYPKDAKIAGVQGIVYVGFFIETDGRVTNVKILRGIGASCDSAAVNVVKKMPNWKPASQIGKPIRCQFNMPIKFMLAGNEYSTGKVKLNKKEKRALKEKQNS